MNDDFERLMEAHQTLIQLKPGDVLTQEMIDDLLLVDRDYRENDERNTEAFHRGYQCGLERGSNADTAKLIEERDDARMRAQTSEILAKYRGEAQVKQMVERFLAWRLPEDFNPDGGIDFTPDYNVFSGRPMKHEPTGTNLFTYTQAEAMVRHILDAAGIEARSGETGTGSTEGESPTEGAAQPTNPTPQSDERIGS